MRAYREDILEARCARGSLIFRIKVVVTANVLHQMIQASESIRAPMKFAVLARMFGILSTKGFEMAIEDINSREESAAFASVGLMLCYF
jgi:hypothetical protein